MGISSGTAGDSAGAASSDPERESLFLGVVTGALGVLLTALLVLVIDGVLAASVTVTMCTIK